MVKRLDGHVAKFLGDGVLAISADPRAAEDDAERAVRAGLALVQAVSSFRPRATACGCRCALASPPAWWSLAI